jgi:ferredoxin-nitrite reductase
MRKLEAVSLERNKKLNAQEGLKAGFESQEAFERLLGYAKNGYESISDADKSFLLKNFGIFDRPATPQRFMLRVRIPGGRLTNAQAIRIGELAQKYGNDYIDLTTRAQLELRYLCIEDIPSVLGGLAGVGITTYQTGVDNFRNIVCDPFGGLSADSVLDCYESAKDMQALFLHQEEWICALPRKFNIAVSGGVANRCNLFGHDFALALAQKDGIWGYNLYLGGKVGVLAKNADIFVLPADAPRLFEAVAKMFREFGFRDNRNKNRLKFLIDAVGMDEVRAEIVRFAGVDFAKAGRTMCKIESEQSFQVSQTDGKLSVMIPIPAGIFSGSAMLEAAAAADECGSGDIRLTVEQKLYIVGVKQQNLQKLDSMPITQRYSKNKTPFHTRLIACAGTEHCPFGVIPNKPNAIEVADYLSERMGELDTPIRMYWSACPKGCGIHGAGDIGLLGGKAHKDGVTILAADIFLGGSLTGEGAEASLVVKSAPLEEIGALCEQIVTEYARLKLPLESFESFYKRYLSRFSRYALGFLMRFNAVVSDDLKIELSQSYERVESAEIYDFGLQLFANISDKQPFEDNSAWRMFGKKAPSLKVSDLKDPAYASLIKAALKMLDPDHTKRYQAFTEVWLEVEPLVQQIKPTTKDNR